MESFPKYKIINAFIFRTALIKESYVTYYMRLSARDPFLAK